MSEGDLPQVAQDNAFPHAEAGRPHDLQGLFGVLPSLGALPYGGMRLAQVGQGNPFTVAVTDLAGDFQGSLCVGNRTGVIALQLLDLTQVV